MSSHHTCADAPAPGERLLTTPEARRRFSNDAVRQQRLNGKANSLIQGCPEPAVPEQQSHLIGELHTGKAVTIS